MKKVLIIVIVILMSVTVLGIAFLTQSEEDLPEVPNLPATTLDFQSVQIEEPQQEPQQEELTEEIPELPAAEKPAPPTDEPEIEEIPPDSDNDGVLNEFDLCPDSRGEEVDENGCSAKQFCWRINVESRSDQETCRKADWKDNEDLLAKDCIVKFKQEENWSKKKFRCTTDKNPD